MAKLKKARVVKMICNTCHGNGYVRVAKINGDPSKNKIDYVNWIELIKFEETRNYVQRVLENVNVYKYMITGKPVEIKNYFKE